MGSTRPAGEVASTRPPSGSFDGLDSLIQELAHASSRDEQRRLAHAAAHTIGVLQAALARRTENLARALR